MSAKLVDYSRLLENVIEMINVLEYDGMRSAGKAKLNSGTLVNLYALKDRYSEQVCPKEVPEVPKEVSSVKKPAGRPAKPTV